MVISGDGDVVDSMVFSDEDPRKGHPALTEVDVYVKVRLHG